MDSKVVCLWDQPLFKIRVYSREKFKKLADFGSRGAGPADFIAISSVYVFNNSIYVNAFPKLAIFSLDGHLINEIKCTGNSGNFIPIGNNFVGTQYPPENPNSEKTKLIYALYDSKLKKIKDLYVAERKRYMVPEERKIIIYPDSDYTDAVVYNNKLIIGDTAKGFYFCIFDFNGKKLYEINRPYTRRKITQEEVDEDARKFRKSIGETRYQMYFSNVDRRARGFYPAFDNFKVNGDKIFAFSTGKTRESKNVLLILDLKGKLIKETVSPGISLGLGIKRAYIDNGSIFFMDENEKTEQWELHRIKID